MQRFGSASAAKLFAEKIISIGPALVFCLVGNCVPTSHLSKQNPPVFDFINKKEKEKNIWGMAALDGIHRQVELEGT